LATSCRTEFGYVNPIASYIDNLPDLKEIVLRGCGTAGEPETKPDMPYDVKKVEVPYEQQVQLQGNNQLVIQQKETENNTILTKLSWMQQDSKGSFKREVMETEEIEKITQKKLTTQQLQSLEKTPGVPLLKHSNEYVCSQRRLFFNKDQALFRDQQAQIKKAIRRARTEDIPGMERGTSVGKNSTLLDVLDKMTPEQKNRVSVKAYVGGYEVYQGRVLPTDDHGQSTSPKSLRVGPK